jgi:hypothetical protein
MAWIMAPLACAVAAGLSAPAAANAQQDAALDQYRLEGLPTATGSERRGQPGAAPASLSPADASRLARAGEDETGGVVVSVLAIGLAATSCAGGLVARRRRLMGDHTP